MFKSCNPVRIALFAFLCGALLSLSGLSTTVLAQSAKFDTSYISDESFFVVRFDIKRLVSMEKMNSENLKTIDTALKKNLGKGFYATPAVGQGVIIVAGNDGELVAFE